MVLPRGCASASEQALSFARAVTAPPSCASCLTMLLSAETNRDSQAMSSSWSEQSAADEICGAPTFRPALDDQSNKKNVHKCQMPTTA